MKAGPERIDYNETPDVTEVHAAVKREYGEPRADVTPLPLWLTGICGAAVAWAGLYFGIFNGGLSGDVYNEYQSSPAVLFPLPQKKGGAEQAGAEMPLAQQGKAVYANCQACHQPTGQGVPGQFPALAGAEWVKGGEKRVLAIILKGLTGPITVHGSKQTFSGNMVPWEQTLTSKKIAAVASYIRSEWGNGAAEVTVADVEAAKKEFAGQKAPWTEEQLLQIPDENFETGGAAPAPAAPGTAAATSTAQTPAAPAPGAVPAAAPVPGAPAVALVPGAPAPAAPAAAPAVAAAFDIKASVERGKPLYLQTCVACHQPTGMGLPGAFPPLAKSEYVVGDPRRMVAIMLKGLQGPVTINGMPFNNIMLPVDLQFPVLKDDAKVADVANYARNSFGNEAKEHVTPELVTAVRKEFAGRATPFTEADIKAFPPAPAK
jgi:mono/diheme cytochrome c family protein